MGGGRGGEGLKLQMCGNHTTSCVSPPAVQALIHWVGPGSLQRGLCVSGRGILQPSHLSGRDIPGEGEGRRWGGVHPPDSTKQSWLWVAGEEAV